MTTTTEATTKRIFGQRLEQRRSGLDWTPDEPAQRPGKIAPLPTFATPLLGREAELAQLDALLAEPGCRLLTIVGPGGSGKTRLAAAIAQHTAAEYPDSVCFVTLASVATPDLVAPAIAAALGCAPAAKACPLDDLRGLRKIPRLLVLDHYEQPAFAADQLTLLLEGLPDLRILTTSRQRLSLCAESVFELRGLLPGPPRQDGRATASDLFVYAARRGNAGFHPTAAEAEAIERICRLVDGNPLAIEIAAAWVRMLPCAEMAVQLAHCIDLRVATAGNVQLRNRSLCAVCAYFWQLLSPSQQRALSRLAVFRGGFSAQAAQHILSDDPLCPQPAALATLAALADKALVRRTGTRYELHEAVRQYAAAQLAANPAAQQCAETRHARFFADLIARSEHVLRGCDQQRAVQLLEAEIDNLRYAWAYATSHGATELLTRMAHGLGWFCELRHWLPEAAPTRPPDNTR